MRTPPPAPRAAPVPASTRPSLAVRLRARRAWVVAGLALADVVVIQASVLVLDTIRNHGQWRLLAHPGAWRLAILATVSILIAHHVVGLYDRPWERGRSTLAALCAWGAGLTLIVFATVRTILGMPLVARGVLFSAWAVVALSSLGVRTVAAAIASREPPHRTLIVGAGPAGASLARRIREDRGRAVVGFVDADPGLTGGSVEDAPVLGRPEDLRWLIGDLGATEVIVATGALDPWVRLQLGWEVAAQGVRVIVLPGLYDLLLQQARARQIRDVLAFELPGGPAGGLAAALKRAIDVGVALGVVVALAPLWLLIALAIRLDSRGPAIYTQERVGLGGRRFPLFKFRTMVDGAEEATGPVLAARRDPRITRAGRVLRRLGLDELPQALNVLRGEMSLVGPRPERPEFVEQYLREVPGYGERLLVRPGVTGLAQVTGRYDTPAAEKLKFDLLYVRSASLVLDARIVLETARMVLAGRPRY